jgi:hypothetical protein
MRQALEDELVRLLQGNCHDRVDRRLDRYRRLGLSAMPQ